MPASWEAASNRVATAAQGIYEQNLALFFGQYDSSLFYEISEDYVVSEEFILAAEGYIMRYPNDETSKICEYVLDLVDKYPNNDILGKINTYLEEFINNADWLPLDATTDENHDIYKEEILY